MDNKKWKVKAKDGNIYGPADTETVKKWFRENRISKEDSLSSVDAEEWKKPSEISEFSAAAATEVKTIFSLPPAQNRTLTTQVVSDGWEVLKANPFPIIGTSLLYLVIVIGISIILRGRSLTLIRMLISPLIVAPLAAGLCWYCLGKIRNQEVGVSALFDGFKVFLPALGAYFLIYIFTVLGFIALIIPGIILSLAYTLTYFFIIDKNMGPWEAMKASFDMTKGFRWRILAIGMLCSLINILGLLCLGVGIFVTLPLSFLAPAALYQRLSTGNIHESQKQTDIKEFLLGGILPAIAIIGMLTAVMMPALFSAREMAHRASCMSNLKEIGFALNRYSDDYDGQFPPTLQQLYPKYVNTASVFWCPSDKDPRPADINNNEVDGINSARISYQYSPGHNTSEPSNISLVWDNGCSSLKDDHGKKGGNVLYLDGHVQWVPKEKWGNPAHGEDSYHGKSQP